MAVNLSKLEDHMKDVVKKFNELKKAGIDEEIMIIYLADKTHISKSNVRNLLKHQEEFYSKLLGDAVAEKI